MDKNQINKQRGYYLIIKYKTALISLGNFIKLKLRSAILTFKTRLQIIEWDPGQQGKKNN
jgi:hypothetical protein